MFPPLFPIYIRALVPLYRYAPLVWLGGVVCLWLTRYTHQLGERWGKRYYALSAIIRPAGVLLIAIGWLALYAPADVPALLRTPTGYLLPWLPMRSLTEGLCWVAALGFFAFGVWAVVTLGLRRSFLYRSTDDSLVTRGPYALVRHPQFLATIGTTFFATRVFQPQGFPFFGMGGYTQSVDANWVLFALALWVLAVLEDRELAAHFPEYEAYARRVPRLFPN
ncbi:MAG: hypothetical protein QME94_04245 [Anaerolineae bacterium]|nr:hypothetical protein [Anaerolineae bacterium]